MRERRYTLQTTAADLARYHIKSLTTATPVGLAPAPRP